MVFAFSDVGIETIAVLGFDAMKLLYLLDDRYQKGMEEGMKAWKKACPSEALKLPGRCAGKGYGKNCKEFTPMQVSYIIYFLGEP